MLISMQNIQLYDSEEPFVSYCRSRGRRCLIWFFFIAIIINIHLFSQ